LSGSFNSYGNLINATISICQFDPGDDQVLPSDDTMCATAAPGYADMGSVNGSDPTCTTDTTGTDPAHKDCGRISSCAGGAGCAELGNTGTGVWVRSAFSLSPFAGRLSRLRWIGSQGGGWSFGITRSALEPEPGAPVYQYNEMDDGWFIDDIVLTDLRNQHGIFAPDDLLGLASCSNQGDPGNCGSVTINIAGSIAKVLPSDPAGRLLASDAMGGPVILDARTSVADTCTNGILQTRWSLLDSGGAVSEILSDFSPAGFVRVAPLQDATYRVEVRCSSDQACSAQKDVQVQAYPGDGSDIDVTFTIPVSGNVGMAWTSRPQPPGISGYEVHRLQGVAPIATLVSGMLMVDPAKDTCLSPNIAQPALNSPLSKTDVAPPAPGPGEVQMWSVTHHSVAPNAKAPLGSVAVAGDSCP